MIFSEAPRANLGTPKHTNCIVTMIWADGVNRTPPMMFSCNPAFQTEKEWLTPRKGRKRNMTAKRKAMLSHKLAVQKEFGIQDCQIHYLDLGDMTYCKESAEIVRIFFNTYKDNIPSKSAVFHDAGNAFSKVKDEITAANIVDRFVEYPPCVHEILSPNDNNLHGACKAIWRNGPYYMKDDVHSTLYFVHLLSNFKSELVVKYFNINFGLSPEIIVNREWCRTQVSVGKSVKSGRIERFQYCRKMYEEYKSLPYNLCMYRELDGPLALNDGLDGDYWTVFV